VGWQATEYAAGQCDSCACLVYQRLTQNTTRWRVLASRWQLISYQVFEMTNATGDFAVRANKIVEIIKEANLKHLKAIAQFRVNNETQLKIALNKVVANGGEGLMLHRADAAYVTGRSDLSLKLKLLLDAEATEIAHFSGMGNKGAKWARCWWRRKMAYALNRALVLQMHNE
jgi:DNA ligase-1